MSKQNEYIEELFNTRYTCKGYDPDKSVSDEDWHTILEAGRLSPSSMGFEPWKFIRLKNKDVIEEIKPYAWGAQAALEGASHILLILNRTPEHLHPDSEYLRYIQEDMQSYPADKLPDRIERFRSFQEHDFDLTTDRKLEDWIRMQTYIPFTNMLTVAAMLGVDSTPIEGFDREKLHEIFTRNKVYDPKEYKLASIISFGYTNRDHRDKTRRKLEEVYEEF